MPVNASLPGRSGPPSGDTYDPLTYRDVTAIALPIMLSNATTPLIGLVDTIVVGQLGEPHLIGGVAVGAQMFNFLYWMLMFLRMGTTGLTAQAEGARDALEVTATLQRALLIAVAAAMLLLLGQVWIAWAGLTLMGASTEVTLSARAYFDMRIWGAPAGLINIALIGWFVGIGRAGVTFWLQLLLNLVNMGLASLFVLQLGQGVAGAGAAALIAEWIAALAGLLAAGLELRRRAPLADLRRVLDGPKFSAMARVNSDIAIRTFSALTAFWLFTAIGARSGDATLAANAALHALAMTAVFLLDGFAFAAETLVGQAIGAKRRDRLDRAVKLATSWAAIIAVVLTAVMLIAGPSLIDVMTPNAEVRTLARTYLIWAAATPVVGIWCFLLDGIFIGATRTRDMRNMMLVSFAGYLGLLAILYPLAGNHGLWISVLGFYVLRAITLAQRYPALAASANGSRHTPHT